MDFFMKLPRNKREMALFMAIVSVISVNIIAPLITFFELGFHFSVWLNVLRVIPFIWMSVIILVLVTYQPAKWLTSKIVSEGDSFRAFLCANTVASVFCMSLFLTVIGTWIGSRSVSWEPLRLFFYKWPRNFTISLVVEAFIAQPFARAILFKLHQQQEVKVAA
jgi:hypothetical protein